MMQKSILVTIRRGEGVTWEIRKAKDGHDYLALRFKPKRAAALRNLLNRSINELVALLDSNGSENPRSED